MSQEAAFEPQPAPEAKQADIEISEDESRRSSALWDVHNVLAY
jgi:hypothetical protein